MGLFSSIVGGITGIFSSKSKAKQAQAERDAEAERTKQAQIAAQQAAQLEEAKLKNIQAQVDLNKSKMLSYLPYVGGGVAAIGVIVYALKK